LIYIFQLREHYVVFRKYWALTFYVYNIEASTVLMLRMQTLRVVMLSSRITKGTYCLYLRCQGVFRVTINQLQVLFIA